MELSKVTWPTRKDTLASTSVMPGDNVSAAVELITPIAMEKELRFAIREGGRTVGAGVISEVVE